jgi:pimeloyl-ACP methyl ester carboxylesterase
MLVIHCAQSPIPVAKLVVLEGGGHWPWLEEPGFVRKQVAEWLAKAGSAKSG